MVDKVHAQNAQLMISVWPKFYPTTANYKELDAAGFMYHGNIEAGALDWVGPGYTNSFYDPYSKAARDIYWRQVNEKLNVLGVDAWWMDATEPDCIRTSTSIHQGAHRPDRDGPGRAITSTPMRWCTPAACTKARAQVEPDKRVFILTRSGFAGMQRNAAAVWSGDIASRWDDLHDQISAGVSIGYSGLPNWTFDIGGFANESALQHPKPAAADLEEWRELNLRWFQFGAFAPLFRSHGEFPLREIYNLAPPGIGGLTTASCGTTSCAIACCRTSTRWRRTLTIATAPSCAGWRWTSPMTSQRATCATSTCSARRSWSRRCTSSRRARGRSIYRPVPTGTTSTRARRPRAGRPSTRRRRSTHAAVRACRFDRAGGPGDAVHRGEAGAPITLLVFTGADGSFDSTKTTA